MKQYGFVGKGTGKLGASVFAISGGEQIVRQYNPVVSNPNTEAQVAQRAKLKLMSQLAASLSGVIAIPKQGLVSSRNLFIKENIGNATFEEGVAKVNFLQLQISKGVTNLPGLTIATSGGAVSVKLSAAAPEAISRVVYVIAKAENNAKINVLETVVVSEAGNDRDFLFISETPGGAGIIVLAYGMMDKEKGVTTKFEDYNVVSAEEVAQLITSRAIGVGDYAMTRTFGAAFSE